MGSIHIVLICIIVSALSIIAGIIIGKRIIKRQIHEISDYFVLPKNYRSQKQTRQDKHMQLLNELCNLDALEERKMDDGAIKVSLFIYKK